MQMWSTHSISCANNILPPNISIINCLTIPMPISPNARESFFNCRRGHFAIPSRRQVFLSVLGHTPRFTAACPKPTPNWDCKPWYVRRLGAPRPGGKGSPGLSAAAVAPDSYWARTCRPTAEVPTLADAPLYCTVGKV